MNKTKQKKLLKLISSLLYSRRNNNIKNEQYYYEKIFSFCDKEKINIDYAIEQGEKYLKRNSVAANMNSIV